MSFSDRLVIGGVVALIVATPLAIGSVHPWAFKPVEILTFAIAAACLGKLWWTTRPLPSLREVRGMTALGAAFVTLIGLQLCPFPPRLLKLVSPSTYEVYRQTLAGWPSTVPYSNLRLTKPAETGLRDSSVTPAAFTSTASAGRKSAATSAREPAYGIWRPLSLAPDLTRAALLETLALLSLFVAIASFPIGDGGKDREKFFRRVVFGAILISGLLVAGIGLVERVAWNGKILWCFVPADWGAPNAGGLPRASGPFVNPDHFGNYLAMVVPLVVAVTFFRSSLMPEHQPGLLRIACFGLLLVIFCALVLSLSRGAWMGAIAGLMVLSRVVQRRLASDLNQPAATAGRERGRAGFFASSAWMRVLLVVGFALLLGLSLTLVGPKGREQTGVRLQQTASDDGDLGFRVSVWEDSLRMTRDFSVVGVGLGAWPALFPRYRRGPWSDLFLREAHNDYVQLLAEAGILGVCGAVGFVLLALARIGSGMKRVDELDVPLTAGLLGGLAAMGMHEFFDFSFRVPANAVLFTVMFALAFRITSSRDASEGFSLPLALLPAGIVGLLLIAGAAALQPPASYESDAPAAATIAGARGFVLEHPASSPAHLALAAVLPDGTAKRAELERALWLSPVDPYARDKYIELLARAGESDAVAQQLSLSVLNSPAWGTHRYLNPAVILWLSMQDREAIASGLKDAVSRNYGGAVESLARFYDTLGCFSKEAEVYLRAARRASHASTGATYHDQAGEAFTRAGDLIAAEKQFLAAQDEVPGDQRSYADLITLAYGPQAKMALAKAAVERGLAAGVDPAVLYGSLAAAAQRANDPALAQDAIIRLTRSDPSFENTTRLGQWYLQAGKPELAARTFQRAVRMNPSAEAYHLLAVARERNYDYPGADKDYARAVQLAPDNLQFRREYTDFRERIGYQAVPR